MRVPRGADGEPAVPLEVSPLLALEARLTATADQLYVSRTTISRCTPSTAFAYRNGWQ